MIHESLRDYAIRPGILGPLLALMAVGWPLSMPAWAEFREDFEAPRTSWRTRAADTRWHVSLHARTQRGAHAGQRCEQLTFRAIGNALVHLTHDVGQARVIPELAPSVWVKTDRPGVHLLARIVLPRSVDPQSGKPLTVSVRGGSAAEAGHWQRLAITNIPQQLDRQVRVLRAQLGPYVDLREAYLDQILLSVFVAKGVTNVWIDDLVVSGFVGVTTRSAPSHGERNPHARQLSHTDAARSQPSDRRDTALARLEGSVLVVQGRPMFARMIQHQGESLELLGRLGFNAVRLAAPPTTIQLQDAQRLGLWLVAPPPDVQPGRQLGPLYDRVLAWDLGRRLSRGQLSTVGRLAEQIRAADSSPGRPLVGGIDANLRQYSQHLDLLILGRLPLGTSFPLAEYGTWLRERPRLARPGTPFWAVVQTELDDSLQRQIAALARSAASTSPDDFQRPGVQSDQIRLLAYSAVAAGAGGLCFQSLSPLNSSDLQTRLRAVTLQLLNLELSLLEPWAAGGKYLTTVGSSDPRVRVAILKTERAHLLLPILLEPDAQHVAGPPRRDILSMVIPHVPESSNAYQLTSAALRPLRHKRVAGGTRVTLERFGLTSPVVLTQDPLVLSSLSHRVAAIRQQATQLRREIAAHSLAIVEQVDRRLADQARAAPKAGSMLNLARTSLSQSGQRLQGDDLEGAQRYSAQTMDWLARLRLTHWRAAASGSSVSSPLRANFQTLPLDRVLAERLGRMRLGPNNLAGGDFEDLDQMLQSGWRHFQHQQPGVQIDVELSGQAPHGGSHALKIQARRVPRQAGTALVESAPVWINSAPVTVHAGQIVRIHGWARVPRPLTGNSDGLLVIDSLGGLPLAKRIQLTDTWQEFAMLRAADKSGRLTITFALTGLGEAFLDDVTISIFH